MTEGMRWRITKAVRASDLPAPARLIMLVLADVAEVGTAEIPERFTPSLNVLAAETGLDKSTVKRHLNALDKGGWLERTQPVAAAQWRGERTRYRLTLPVGAQDAQSGRTEPLGWAHSEPGVGAESAGGRRRESHQETDRSDLDQTEVRSTAVEPVRADVARICGHLADRIEGNGSKRPTVTKKWLEQARLLIDKDGRAEEQVIRAIDWCQDDSFWRGNILSMPTLREKYDQLRLAAQRKNGTNGSRPSTTDRRVADVLALKGTFTQETEA